MIDVVTYIGDAHRAASKFRSDILRDFSHIDRVNLEGDIYNTGFDLEFHSSHHVVACLVCFEDGRPAGFLELYPRSCDECLYLAVGVRPDCRNRKIGENLIHAARRFANSHGFPRIYYCSFRDNLESVNLAKKLLFEECEGWLDEDIWYGGYIDA